MKRFAILAVLALSQVAFAADTQYLIPSAANVQGLFGAYFKTRVTLMNSNPQPISLLIVLATTTGALTRTIDVPASTFFTYQNFLADVFGYSGGGAIGIAEVTNSRRFGVTAEVYVDGPNGRYSTPLTLPTFEDRVLYTGDPGQSLAFGLHADGNNRVNFGCTNLASVPTTVRATVYAFTANGVRTTATVDLNLSAQSWQQMASPIGGDLIYIDFRVTSGGSRTFPVYCYGVGVNNQSNDGTAVNAETLPQ